LQLAQIWIANGEVQRARELIRARELLNRR